MKKFTQLMAFAATAMMFFSCSSTEDTDNAGTPADHSSLKATMAQLTDDDADAQPSTRTALGGTTVKWVDGDAVNVFDGNSNRKFTAAEVSEDGTSCTFHGPSSDYKATSYTALYPYSMKATISGNKISGVRLPDVQKAVDGGFDPSCNLMVATASADGNDGLQFSHLCSYIKITPQFDCSNIVFTATDKQIAGTFDVTVKADGSHSIDNLQSATGKVSLVGDIKGGSTYYIAVLPGSFSNGITVELQPKTLYDQIDWTNSVANIVTYTRSAGSLTANVAKIKNLGSVKESNCTKTESSVEFVDMGYDGDPKAAHGHKVLWAKCNLGAETETQSGGYYAWGETSTKQDYSDATYLCKDYYPETLDEAHDAATANLGHGWHMPSADNIVQMKENTIFVYTDNYNNKGISGFLVYPGGEGKYKDVKNYQVMSDNKIRRFENGCSPKSEIISNDLVTEYVASLKGTKPLLFFPFTGTKIGGYHSNDAVRIWLNTRGKAPLYSRNDNTLTAYYWGLDREAFNILSYYVSRYNGMTIRPVLEVEW